MWYKQVFNKWICSSSGIIFYFFPFFFFFAAEFSFPQPGNQEFPFRIEIKVS